MRGLKVEYREGVSRGFGFLGFADPENGDQAIRYFNKSFIGTRRILVEVGRLGWVR